MAKDLLNCDRSTLFLVDHSTDDDEKGLPVKNVNKDQLGVNEDAVEIPSGSRLLANITDGAGKPFTVEVQVSQGIVGYVARKNQQMNIPDAYKERLFK